MTDIQSRISHSTHSLERLSVLGNPHLVTLEQEITALSDGTFVAYATIPWLVSLRCFATPLHTSSLLRLCRLQLHYDRDACSNPTNGCPSGSIAFILICSFSPFCVCSHLEADGITLSDMLWSPSGFPFRLSQGVIGLGLIPVAPYLLCSHYRFPK